MGDDQRPAASGGEREERLRELEARVAELAALQEHGALQVQSRTATELLKIVDAPSLFTLVGERIYSIAQGAFVAITEFDARADAVTVRRLECPAADRERIVAIMGRDPVGMSLGVVDEGRHRWKTRRLVRVPGGLHDLFFRQVPLAVCQRLEEELQLGELFGMAWAADDEILGSVALVGRRGTRLSNHELVEQLVAQAALGLKRIRAEEARQATEERFRLLFDTTSDGICIHSLDGVVQEVNDAYCAMSGYTRDELRGMPVSRLEAAESQQDVSEHIARVVQGGGHGRFESRHRRKDGTTFDVDISALHLRRAGGQIAIFARDITERKAAEASLRDSERRARELAELLKEADRHKDEFLAMLAHELRNPLAVIASAAQIFASDHVQEGAIGRAREAMERQARHMARLIDDLLDVSRITQGKVSLRTARVDVASVVDAAVEIAAEAIDAKGQHLFLSLPRQPVAVEADAVRLTQVVSNVLNNASKFSPRGGEIQLSIDVRDASVVLSVRDKGEGISADLLPRIFDLFVQGERSPERMQGGLGIGLTMARSLIEAHGGRIQAFSEGPGKGAEFVITLPMASPAPQPVARTDERVEPPPRRRVLVVDDNHDAAEMMRVWLELEGHQVWTGHSGGEAIDLVLRYSPDVALIDLGMPGIDGYEVARRIRRQASFSGMVLVALTGYGQAEDVEASRAAGFDQHLVKPADVESLRAVLRKPDDWG